LALRLASQPTSSTRSTSRFRDRPLPKYPTKFVAILPIEQLNRARDRRRTEVHIALRRREILEKNGAWTSLRAPGTLGRASSALARRFRISSGESCSPLVIWNLQLFDGIFYCSTEFFTARRTFLLLDGIFLVLDGAIVVRFQIFFR
jgi:hypothetical protein